MGMMGKFIVIDTTVSVNEISVLSKTIVYPNPSSGSTLSISNSSLAGQTIYWLLTDLTGRICTGGTSVFSDDGSFSLQSNMAPGMYFVQLKLNNSQSYTLKFLKE
jgi:hypothetical protein